MQDGCKVYMVSYMASLCFMVTWFIFKDLLLEVVGLIQNREIIALRMLTTFDLFYFIMREDLLE